MEQIITVRQAAETLDCTRENVYYLIKHRQIHAIKPGRDWQVDRESVEVYKKMREGNDRLDR